MIIEKLNDKNQWLIFEQKKKDGGHLTPAEEKDLEKFISNEEYTAVVERISNGGFFGMSEVHFVNKQFSEKKRKVFILPREENYVQKMIVYLLSDYDYIFSDNLYSFRNEMGVKKAITALKNTRDIDNLYSYKLDISDYFNSVNVEKILPMAEEVLKDEPVICGCIKQMLSEPYALFEGKPIKVKKGVMAGVPLSSFLSNLYLSGLDRYFFENKIPYARYSDDILFFADTLEKLNSYRDYILKYISDLDLEVNEKKIFFSNPHEPWTFLGFTYRNGKFDVSDAAVKKIKAKMKRKANALIRWKKRKNASSERAARAFIRYFNRKFFENPIKNEMTWCRWFFPIVNVDTSLREIDSYMQDCIRYIVTEKRTKARFNFRYQDMKKLGYISLVHAFYEFKNEKSTPVC